MDEAESSSLTSYAGRSLWSTVARAGRFYYVHRFLMALFGYRLPITAVFKLTSQCNLNCNHCPWEKNQENELSTSEWIQKIDYVYDIGCICLFIEGGEPFLRKDLQQIVSYAMKRGMLTAVITNGTVSMKDVHPDSMIISLDGSRKVHDAVRGSGTFEKVIENIRQIPEQYKVALMSISMCNVMDIEHSAEVFSSITDAVWYNFIYPYGNIGDESLKPEDALEAGRRIRALKKKYPGIINSDRYLGNIGRSSGCRPWWTYTVMPDGTSGRQCTVAQLESCQCERCYLSCYYEPRYALEGSWQAIRFLQKVSGLPRLAFYR